VKTSGSTTKTAHDFQISTGLEGVSFLSAANAGEGLHS